MSTFLKDLGVYGAVAHGALLKHTHTLLKACEGSCCYRVPLFSLGFRSGENIAVLYFHDKQEMLKCVR